MNLAEKMKHRMEQANWHPLTLAHRDYQLDLPEVHGMDEVGFILWRKADNGELEPIASGHTLRGRLVDAEEQPLELTDDVDEVLTTLLDQNDR